MTAQGTINSEHRPVQTTVDFDVPFFDIDSYRIAWHGHYAKYFEVARCQLLKHIKPLRFGQHCATTAILTEWEHRLTIKYIISDRDNNERLTEGRTSQVAIAMPGEITQFINPPILLEKVAKAMEQQ